MFLLRNWGGIGVELGWNPGNMVPVMPGKPAEPDQYPQICDTDCSQSREWGHQGWLGHFQEVQKSQNQVQRGQEGNPKGLPQVQCCGPSSGEIYQWPQCY